MKYLIYTLSGLLLLASCSKGEKNESGNASNSSEGTTSEAANAAVRTSLPDNFYLKLSGTIKDKPIVMELTRHDSTVNGTYYYVSQGKNLSLYGTMQKNGKISMSESVQQKETGGKLEGTIAPNGTFSGNWSGNGKSFPMELKENYENGAAKAEMKVLSESASFKKMKASVGISYPVISLGNASAQDAINKAIEARTMSIGEGEGGSKKSKTVEEALKHCLSGYKEMLEDLSGDDGGMSEREIGEENSQYISLNENGVLAITESGYMDGGGAHPNSFLSFSNYNTNTGAKIKLSDILSSNYKSTLYPVAEKLFRKQNEVTGSWDEAGFEWGEKGKFYLPEENFIIEKEGLLFSYGQYEIGPYALGMPSVFITYSELKPFVKAGSVLDAFMK